MNRVFFFLLLLYHRNRRLLGRRGQSAEAIARERRRRHSRNAKAFHRSRPIVERRIRSKKIPRIALLPPSRSPWRKLYSSRNDQSMVAVTGFDYGSFQKVLEEFAPVFTYNTPFLGDTIVPCDPTKGRKRKIMAEDCLALILYWGRLRGNGTPLQLIFGMTSSNLQMYLRFGRRVFIQVFRKHPLARICLPSAEKIAEYQEAVAARHPKLKDVWATLDGLKLDLQRAPDYEMQNRFFNGWTHGHYIMSIFVFCPDGTIPAAVFNLPGAVHDSCAADWGGIYRKLTRVYVKTGGRATVDSAFNCTNQPFLIKSSQDEFASRATTVSEARAQIQLNREATSMRQAAEWGMNALQTSNPRLVDKFRWEERGERGFILKQIVLAYNLRARMVGINQILNVYMPLLREDAGSIFNEN
jgi:hypothetical protein